MEDNSTPRPTEAAENQPLENPPVEVNPEVQPVTETPLWQPDTETDEDGSTGRGVSKKWIIIGAILFVFLAAAVFLGAQLLKPPTTAEGENGGGPGLVMMGKGGPGGAKSVRIDMTPAAELPTEQPSASGLFVKREDQSLYIGTGNVRMTAKKQVGSSAPDDVSSSYDGPVMEVVVSHETKVYQDITEMTPPDQSDNNGSVAIQQVVKPGSLDDIGKNTLVTIWGEKRGDRYIAKTIVFR